MPGGRDGRCSPAIAILDANVAAAIELLAILEPAVGGHGVTGHRLALQRLFLPHLSRLTLHLLQLGPGGCGVQGREVSMAVMGQCQAWAVEEEPLSLGWAWEPPLQMSSPSSIQHAFAEGLQ